MLNAISKFFSFKENNSPKELMMKENTHPIQAKKLYYLGIKIPQAPINLLADTDIIMQQIKEIHFTGKAGKKFNVLKILPSLYSTKEDAFKSIAKNTNQGISAVIAVQLDDENIEQNESSLYLKSDKFDLMRKIETGHTILTNEVATLFLQDRGKIHFVNNAEFQDKYPDAKYIPVANFKPGQ